MTPQRRRLFAAFLALGLVLAAGLGIAMAVGVTAAPTNGVRDDGSNNQTPIHLTGDLLDSGAQAWTSPPSAYWDLPNTSVPDSNYAMTLNSSSIARTGEFVVDTEVPLYDEAINPVRPGVHVITVCDSYAATAAVNVCTSTNFTVKKGIASFSTTSGRPYQSVTVDGSGWVPGNADEAIQLIWDPKGSDPIDLDFSDTFYPDSSTWTFTFQVPLVDPGTYNILICNVPNSGGPACPKLGPKTDTLLKQFTVVPPTVALNNSSGHSGDTVKVSGSGFYPNYNLFLFIGPAGAPPDANSWVEILPGTQANSDGNFGPSTFTAAGAAGDYSVIACSEPTTLKPSNCDTTDLGQAPYTIIASATPTPSPTPKPTASPTPSPTASPTASPTPSPTPTPSPSPSPTPSPTPSPSPSAAPTATPSPSPTLPPTLAPTAPPTAPPTPAPTPSPTLAAITAAGSPPLAGRYQQPRARPHGAGRLEPARPAHRLPRAVSGRALQQDGRGELRRDQGLDCRPAATLEWAP